jgi:hypothetical protein
VASKFVSGEIKKYSAEIQPKVDAQNLTLPEAQQYFLERSAYLREVIEESGVALVEKLSLETQASIRDTSVLAAFHGDVILNELYAALQCL